MATITTIKYFDISHSDISSFLQCRRQWWFSYVLGYSDNKFPVGAAPAGTRVHMALEAQYPTTPAPPGDPREAFEEIAQADIRRATDSSQPPWVMDKLYDDILLGRRMVADYMQWLAELQPDAEWEPVQTEAKLRYTVGLDDPVWDLLDEPLAVRRRNDRLREADFTHVRLQGKVDLIQQHASTYQPDPNHPRYGQLRLTDWKTTGRTFQVEEGFQRSYQSYFYDMLLELAQDVPLPVQEARERTLSGTATPPTPEVNYRIIQRPRSRNATAEIRDLPISHSSHMRRSRRRQMFSIVADMIDTTLAIDADEPRNTTVHSAERHAAPSPSDACGWCSYRPACDITDDGPDLAIALLSGSPDYVSGQRHQRYQDNNTNPVVVDIART